MGTTTELHLPYISKVTYMVNKMFLPNAWQKCLNRILFFGFPRVLIKS